MSTKNRTVPLDEQLSEMVRRCARNRMKRLRQGRMSMATFFGVRRR